MIFCVVPEELAPELFDRLVDYYADDPDVQVIVDRRRRPGSAPDGRERRSRPPVARSVALPASALE